MRSARGCYGTWFRRKEADSAPAVLHAQCTSAMYSGFPLLQGNAEALDREVGKQSII